MSNRMYRGMLGALLLVSLYFDLSMLMYVIIIVLFFEGITNLILPKLVGLFGRVVAPGNLLFE